MKWTDFSWEQWNHESATKHGCTVEEIESAVRNAGHGFPRKIGSGKLLLQGRGQGGRMLEVIYFLNEDGEAVVIHAIPLITRRCRGGR